ncbi:hypothetical protein B0A50_02771 [Salinomyces thailandicus]|uniref:PROP1-like PPR domain-containing protein n=1 Tax=Salinomyces thailandicus TaxID=706561 RepID=A0A4U0U621_9PEZI|nr:hypothetical protein B0A50_02771 [Salinomyces thailandica]
MLERAKACLQSGARDSVRCAQSVSDPHRPWHCRSKRKLHASFWNHGAGDLDLPPWALPPPSPSGPLSIPRLKHDDKKRDMHGTGRDHDEESAPTSIASDGGLFLDFLYPPQALYWLSRTAGRPWERWERRDSKRLPDGFIQTSRAYASRAYFQDVPPGVERQEDAAQGEERIDASERPGLGPGQRLGKRTELPRTVPEEDETDKEFDSIETKLQSMEMRQSTHGFVDLPGDVAEAQSPVLQKLSNILLASQGSHRRLAPDKARSLSDRVLALYNSLDQVDKDDDRLRVEMLIWLSPYTSNDAEALCSELYRTIPSGLRDLRVYQAALDVFTRRGRHVQALILHKEALRNIPNGDQVTKTFFAYALQQRRWSLAVNIESQYETALMSGQQASGIKRSMFWFHVSQVPRILPHALVLAKYLSALQKARTINDQIVTFAAKIFREALLQEVGSLDPVHSKTSAAPQGGADLPKSSIGRLLSHISVVEDSPKLYEHLLLGMVGDGARYPYAQVHRIVSYTYAELRSKARREPYRMHEGLFMTLLDRLTRFWEMLEVDSEARHSLTVRELLKDWEHDHGKIKLDGVAHLLRWYARHGQLDKFEHWWSYLDQHYPAYEAQRAMLSSTIYIHARRGDLPKAKTAFAEVEKVTSQHNESPALQCWNVLIHAYSRADDLPGGLQVLSDAIERGLKPDEYSFHPIMEMLAKRGDVEGVKDLIHQYDTLAQKKQEAAFYGSLLQALANCGRLEEAESVLKSLITKVKTHKVRGSLTGSFDMVLTGHAMRRDIDATMRTYRWMQSERIRLDSNTFGALIQALTSYRQTNAAWKILRTVMPQHGCRPQAFHYALCMTGYANQREWDKALEVHEHMSKRKIKASFSTNAAYLDAKALKEIDEQQRFPGRYAEPMRLDNTIEALEQILQAGISDELALKQPQFGLGPEYGNNVSVAYMSHLIYRHGREHSFKAVKALLKKYKASTKQLDGIADSRPPIELLVSVMVAYHAMGEHGEVEKCWLLAKEQANEIAPSVPVHPLQPAVAEDSERQLDLMQIKPPMVDETPEAGFQTSADASYASGHSDTDPDTPVGAKQTLLPGTADDGPKTPEPSPGRAYILTRPLRHYLYSLAAQGRTRDILSTVSRLFTEGYTMDNRTWNAFVQMLCKSSPPLVLLAFTLTERFLIPNFPGWSFVNTAIGGYIPNPSARREGLQYIRARYLHPEQRIPQYRTFVTLGAAFLQLRTLEAIGRRGQNDDLKGMEKYVGTMKQVRQQAPKTLFAVQSMPTVDDNLQNRLLRRDG